MSSIVLNQSGLNLIDVRISIKRRKKWQRLLLDLQNISALVSLCLPSVLHGINETCSLWVSKVFEHRDVERRHHVVVFVDEVVAVEHIHAVFCTSVSTPIDNTNGRCDLPHGA
jgi:hypothetical protein